MEDLSNRPEFFTSHNGEKAKLPFSKDEYARRLASLRAIMAKRDIPVVLLTSMQNIAYYSGFLYCAFGRPYGCVVTQESCTTVSAKIDAGQPITEDTLVESGLVRRKLDGVRILAKGDFSAKVDLTVTGASGAAKAAIEGAGGTLTVTTATAAE